jgi:acetate kinase
MTTGMQKPEIKLSTNGFLKTQAEIFKDFSDERLQQLVDGSRVTSFEAREAIMHRGEEATHFGVVLSGAVAGEGGNGRPLGKLNAGETFGELYLMSGNPLLADFVAESVSLFQSLIVAEPGAMQRISRTNSSSS